jgi:predicted transcriptional regulator of viral defense system
LAFYTGRDILLLGEINMNKVTEKFFEADADVFTSSDAANVVGKSGHSRLGLIKRASSKGEIMKIRRGLYCLAPKYLKKPVNVYSLAQRIYGPSYVSMETALSWHGWIPEAVYACTSASYRSARTFKTPAGVFIYKRVPQKIFYYGVERLKDESGNIFFMASPAKALADYIYNRRLNWSKISEAAESLRIEAEDIDSVKASEVSGLLRNYTNNRLRRLLGNWLEDLRK